MVCLTAKPIVDRLESDLQGTADVLRVDIGSSLGSDLAVRFQINSVPTLALFDESGNERWRQEGALPDRTAVMTILGLSP